MDAPKAPSNYKDQKKIDAYVAEKWAELEQTAHLHSIAGEVTDVGIYPVEEKATLKVVGVEEFIKLVRSWMKKEVTLYGFDIKDRIQQLAFASIRNAQSFPLSSITRPWFSDDRRIIDPAAASGIPLHMLLRQLEGEISDIEAVRGLSAKDALEGECRMVFIIGHLFEYF